MYKQVERCRVCGNRQLESVLDLGDQVLTGVFPRQQDPRITRGPLQLVKCVGGEEVCGLLQLRHSFDAGEMYGQNYGYRSGLNPSMVSHLQSKVARICELVELKEGDLVVDIGSNDATTLRAYRQTGVTLVGVDPTGSKFKEYYPEHVELIPDFFSSDLIRQRFGGRKAKVVTSFSMFYDLENPMEFMRQVREVLADDGIWVFEQSYMPTMLNRNSFDTVCHEHLEFYGLTQIQWMAERIGLKLVGVEFNDVNGGSFSVTAAKSNSPDKPAPDIQQALRSEADAGLNTLQPYQAFAERVRQSRSELREFVRSARSNGKVVAALGASTKGNVLLQYCGFTPNDISAVGEVNPDKFGCVTPGSWLPIVPEGELLASKPDYLIVLPWHFRTFFERSDAFREVTLVFPLPKLSIHQPSEG